MPDARPVGAAPRIYRAFLSYDHDDKRFAYALHKKLESYRIDRDLVGRASATGNVPRTLRPIFLDRAELAAGRQLGDELDAALEASDFLIVVCSEFAAQSHYVNNEVRRFKQMGRGDRIIPYILSGEPGDPKRECFMPALKYQVRPDGTLGDGHDEIIGADARAQGDGPELALHKVVARVIGVKLDEILRRAQVAERRQKRIYMGVAGVLGALLIATGVLAYVASSLNTRFAGLLGKTIDGGSRVINQGTRIFAESGVPVAKSVQFLDEARDVLTAVDDFVSRESQQDELNHSRARVQLSYAEAYGALGRAKDYEREATAALEAMRTLVAKKPSPERQRTLVDAYLAEGNSRLLLGRQQSAADSFGQAVAIAGTESAHAPADPDWLVRMSKGYSRLAQSTAALGDRDHARTDGLRAVTIAEQAIALAPGNLDLVELREEARLSFAEILRDLREHTRATELLEVSIAALDSVAAANPSEARWAIHLSGALHEHGYIRFLRKKRQEAGRSYARSLEAIRGRVASDPQNVAVRLAQALAVAGIGDTTTENDIAARQAYHDEASSIVEALLRGVDPENPIWLRFSSELHDTQAAILETKGRLAREPDSFRLAVVAEHEKGLAIREQLLAAFPDDSTIHASLAISHNYIATQLNELKRYAEAIIEFEKGLVHRQTLATQFPSILPNLQGVARSKGLIAATYLRHLKQPALAEALYVETAGIYSQLYTRDPHDGTWQVALASTYRDLGEARRQQAKHDEAIAAFEACIAAGRAVIQKEQRVLARKLPAEREISLATLRIGTILLAKGDPAGAAARLGEGLAAGETLVPRATERDEVWADWRLALAEAFPALAQLQAEAGDKAGALALLLRGHTLVPVLKAQTFVWDGEALDDRRLKIEAMIVTLGGTVPQP